MREFKTKIKLDVSVLDGNRKDFFKDKARQNPTSNFQKGAVY
jgi:hypothetical protein